MQSPTDLWQRYRQAWQQNWRRRKDFAPPQREQHELQFLPSAMALQESPPHPAPRIFIWAVMLFAGLAIAWAGLGRIDVVAVATGKVVPSGKTKVIQPSDTAVITAIHVRDGQMVKAGEVLIELDPTTADADVNRLGGELIAARLDAARSDAMLRVIVDGKPPHSFADHLEPIEPAQREAAARWLQGQYLEYRSSLDQADDDIQQRTAQIQSAQAQVKNLKKSLPIASRLANDYRLLLQQQHVARHEYLEKEQSRLEIDRQLQVQQATLKQTIAAQSEARRRREGIEAQTRRTMLDLQQTATRKLASLEQDLVKARYLKARTHLIAPVDGTIQQLNVHTVGGVVTPAQPLMVIVPLDQPVEVEALLANKDVGFVRPSQPVTVKVETFTYTRYGTLDGEVVSVSGDAIEDERRGLVYSARIRLRSNHLKVNGQNMLLSPGMAVSAEIKTDQRRIISFFLGPLQRYRDESLRER